LSNNSPSISVLSLSLQWPSRPTRTLPLLSYNCWWSIYSWTHSLLSHLLTRTQESPSTNSSSPLTRKTHWSTHSCGSTSCCSLHWYQPSVCTSTKMVLTSWNLVYKWPQPPSTAIKTWFLVVISISTAHQTTFCTCCKRKQIQSSYLNLSKVAFIWRSCNIHFCYSTYLIYVISELGMKMALEILFNRI